jgi:hypothetical protein
MKTLLLILFAVVVGWLCLAVVQGINSGLNTAMQDLDRELRSDADSLQLMESKHKEFYRIQQLSFTDPVTPEHVKGVELDSLNMRLMRLSNWIRFKKATMKAKEKYRKELSEDFIKL